MSVDECLIAAGGRRRSSNASRVRSDVGDWEIAPLTGVRAEGMCAISTPCEVRVGVGIVEIGVYVEDVQ